MEVLASNDLNRDDYDTVCSLSIKVSPDEFEKRTRPEVMLYHRGKKHHKSSYEYDTHTKCSGTICMEKEVRGKSRSYRIS